MVLDTLEAIAGGLLILVLPGLAWSRAIFPEWRISGPLALTRAFETAALAFLLSIVLTILVGFGLTLFPNGAFPAAWSNPVLEAILAGLTGLGAVVAYLRRGFARVAPPAPAMEPAPGLGSPTELLQELVAVSRRTRQIRHELRGNHLDESARSRLSQELRELESRADGLAARREAEYGG
jgi:hypothetical protein